MCWTRVDVGVVAVVAGLSLSLSLASVFSASHLSSFLIQFDHHIIILYWQIYLTKEGFYIGISSFVRLLKLSFGFFINYFLSQLDSLKKL